MHSLIEPGLRFFPSVLLFVTVVAKCRHFATSDTVQHNFILSHAITVQSNHLKSILIISSPLRLGLSSGHLS
jgi:hypothetical protein